MLLGQHFPDQNSAISNLILWFGATSTWSTQSHPHAYVMLGVWCILLHQFGGPGTLSPRQRLPRLGLCWGRLTQLVVRCGCCSVCFPFLALSLLDSQEYKESGEMEKYSKKKLLHYQNCMFVMSVIVFCCFVGSLISNLFLRLY